MTDRTLSQSSWRGGGSWETWLVLGAVALIAGLAVADRLTAWLIGEFPSSALLWQLRFAYLRPIGVFYDIAADNLGAISPAEFSALTLVAALAIAGGAWTRIRLARALSCHLLFGVAATLSVFSWTVGDDFLVHAAVGVPSPGYTLLGAILTLAAAALCLRIHAEYLGWNPASSRALRRLRFGALRLRWRIADRLADLVEQPFPAMRGVRAVPRPIGRTDQPRPR